MFQGIVDLSFPIFEGMPTDDLGPKFWVRLSHAAARQLYQNTQSREGRVFLTTDHVGTHLDGPLRFDPEGVSVERIPLDRVIRPARMIDLRALGPTGSIGAPELERAGDGVRGGDAVVLWTGHDREIKNPGYFWHRPQLTIDGAEWLVEQKVGIVAADFPGIGKPGDDRYEVKRMLHRGGVLTVEQLCNLGELEGRSWHLCVAPVRIRGAAGSLLRAVGLIEWRAREVVDLALDTFRQMSALGGAVPTIWTRANHELTSFFYQGEVSYQTTSMFLSEHAGTHLDAPYHFDEHGLAIDEIPLDQLLAPARVIDMSHKQPLESIAPSDLEKATSDSAIRIEPGDALVIWTEHSKNYHRPDYTTHRPFITAEGAAWLAEKRPGFVVTDLVGLDEPTDPTTPVHMCLLHAGIPFLQVTTNLSRLAEGRWYVAAFPLKLTGGTGSPLRPFAASV
jgi:kynurenine formamidase